MRGLGLRGGDAPGGRPGRVSQKPVQRLRGLVRLIHPKNGYAGQEGGRKLGLRQPAMASSLSGQAPAGDWLCLGCGRCAAREEAAPDILWSPSKLGEVTSPHPLLKSKPPLGLAPKGLLSVCPALPSQTELPSPHMYHSSHYQPQQRRPLAQNTSFPPPSPF